MGGMAQVVMVIVVEMCYAMLYEVLDPMLIL
jgi:hypothetical protein